jgi:Family of unknown function (DUF6703)
MPVGRLLLLGSSGVGRAPVRCAFVPSSFRASLERVSLPLLTRISALPRWAPFLAVLALLVAGILIQGWGWVFTAIVALFLAWLLALSWPRLTSVQRLMRFAVILLAGVIAVIQASPRS